MYHVMYLDGKYLAKWLKLKRKIENVRFSLVTYISNDYTYTAHL